MLLKLYNKSKIWFAVAFIVAYCLLFSLGDAVSEHIGIKKLLTVAAGLLLSAVLLLFLRKNSLFKEYGLCRAELSPQKMLLYLPLLLMLFVNLMFGAYANLGIAETVLYIAAMLLVGFLEEIIFRGLLFRAMWEDSPKAAVIVSSITFGMGHIINLVNGSGADLLPSILQVVYATAAGFMFVMIFIRSKSLIACILAHGVFNSLSVFSHPSAHQTENQIFSAVILTLITATYGIYLAGLKEKNNE